MKNVFLPSAKSSESFVHILLNTNYIPVLFIYYIMYLSIAVVLITVFETFFVDDMKDPRFTRALEQVTLILGFMYSIWVTLYLRGYSTLSSKFDSLLASVEKFAERFFNLTVPFHDCHHSKKASSSSTLPSSSPVHDIKSADNVSHHHDIHDTDGRKLIDIMEQIRDTCLAISNKGYLLFSEQEPDYVSGFHAQVQKLLDQFENCNDTFNLIYELQSNLLIHMKIMEDNLGYLSPGDIVLLHKDLDNIRDVCRDIESGSRVTEPGIFTKIIFTSLMVYFILWIPYVQWILLGSVPTIFVFPVVMTMLTVLVISREWLGDAFDKKRPISYMNFYNWRQRSYARILGYYLKPIIGFQEKNQLPTDMRAHIWHRLNALSVKYPGQSRNTSLISFYFEQFGKQNQHLCELLNTSLIIPSYRSVDEINNNNNNNNNIYTNVTYSSGGTSLSPHRPHHLYNRRNDDNNNDNQSVSIMSNVLLFNNALPFIAEEQQNNTSD